MSDNIFAPGPEVDVVRSADGKLHKVPDDWTLVEPGDPALTRRVKAAGVHWVVQERVGRRTFSRGVWAPVETVERLITQLAAERSTETYAKKRAADALRRESKQTQYVEDFHAAVVTFLNFHSAHADLAHQFALRVTEHATPVGSGTVARTERIPIERRAEAAVIAWMRHQTTGYDSMKIARVKGKRREVRRMLAARSKELLEHYRTGDAPPVACPLMAALQASAEVQVATDD